MHLVFNFYIVFQKKQVSDLSTDELDHFLAHMLGCFVPKAYGITSGATRKYNAALFILVWCLCKRMEKEKQEEEEQSHKQFVRFVRTVLQLRRGQCRPIAWNDFPAY